MDTVNKSLVTDCLISVHVNVVEYDHTGEAHGPQIFPSLSTDLTVQKECCLVYSYHER